MRLYNKNGKFSPVFAIIITVLGFAFYGILISLTVVNSHNRKTFRIQQKTQHIEEQRRQRVEEVRLVLRSEGLI